VAGEFLIKLSRETDKQYFMKKSTGRKFRVHMHDFYEIELCLKGSGINRIDGEKHDFAPGTCFLYFPHTIHELYTEEADGEFTLLDIAFTGGFLHGDVMHLIENLGYPLRVQLDNELCSIYETLFSELETESIQFDDMMFRAQLEAMICRIMSINARSENTSLSGKQSGIQIVLRYLAENVSRVPAVKELAALVNVSPTYFGEYFRSNVGVSYRQYVTDLRMKRACHLIENSPYSIKEIAELCGFSGESSFGHAFRSYFGISASEIRERKSI